jgi:transcriptional regulator with XRE-family HTH domain
MAKGKYEQWLTKEGLILIEGWARDGLTDEQIAHNIGISRSTLNEWKKKYPDISDTLKRGKEVVDRQVENALLKRALGYQFEEETYVSVQMSREEYDLRVDIELGIWNKQHPNATQDERDLFILSIPRTKEVLEKKVVKQVSPDTTAQIFWLKNRKPADWRDKREIEHGGEIINNIDLSGLSVEELRKLARSDD